MTSLAGAPTHYPSSSKNLTTTRGVFRKPSLMSAGRLSILRTSPGQKRLPHLHQTTSWWLYLGSDITDRSEIKKTNRQGNLSLSWNIVRSHDKQTDDKRHCRHTVLFIPNQTNCGCHHSEIRQAFPALRSTTAIKIILNTSSVTQRNIRQRRLTRLGGGIQIQHDLYHLRRGLINRYQIKLKFILS